MCTPGWERFNLRSRRLSAVSTKESAHIDQASQAAVRRPFPPLLRPCFLAPSVTTPLYSTTGSYTLRQPLLGGNLWVNFAPAKTLARPLLFLHDGDTRRGVTHRTTTYKRPANAPPARWRQRGVKEPPAVDQGLLSFRVFGLFKPIKESRRADSNR